jgi:hypothetical protein
MLDQLLKTKISIRVFIAEPMIFSKMTKDLAMHILIIMCHANFSSDRLDELGTLTYSYSVDVLVNTSFHGLCTAETRTLRKALAGTNTELKCPMNDTTSCVLDYGPTSIQRNSMCLAMGGQLFVIANKTAECYRVDDYYTNEITDSYSESNEYYCPQKRMVPVRTRQQRSEWIRSFAYSWTR